jgi:hypothetical protein
MQKVQSATQGTNAYPVPEYRVADVYLRRTLDAIVEVALAISRDVFDHPGQYRGLSDRTRDGLTEFRSSLEQTRAWPNAVKRETLSGGVVGSRLCGALTSVRREACVFVELGSDRAAEPIRRAFLESARAVRSRCQSIEGTLAAAVTREARPGFDAAVRLLLDEEVARALGSPPILPGGWPDKGIYSNEAAQLCDAVTTRLERPIIEGWFRPSAMSEHKFTVLQRVAYHGATTISGILSHSLDEHDPVDAVVESAYHWAHALRDLLAGIDVVRALTDLSYRRSLYVAERDILPPHPSGDVEPTTAALVVRPPTGNTVSMFGEICCCGGSDFCSTNVGFTCYTSTVCVGCKAW